MERGRQDPILSQTVAEIFTLVRMLTHGGSVKRRTSLRQLPEVADFSLRSRPR
jgi:hypothetical protein